MEISFCFHEHPYEGIATIFAHNMTAMLMWHVQIFVTMGCVISVTFELMKYLLMKWAKGQVNNVDFAISTLSADGQADCLTGHLHLQNDNEASVLKWVFMIWILVQQLGACVIYSLWPIDAIRQHRSGSTLVQLMAWCLMAPSHYLNQCWLIISGVVWHSLETNFTRSNQVINS